jgi:hypothetical protein
MAGGLELYDYVLVFRFAARPVTENVGLEVVYQPERLMHHCCCQCLQRIEVFREEQKEDLVNQ